MLRCGMEKLEMPRRSMHIGVSFKNRGGPGKRKDDYNG